MNRQDKIGATLVILTILLAIVGATDKIGFTMFIFRNDWAEEFAKLNFSHSDWISITISKILGYAIILGSTVVMLPQVIKLATSKSWEGLVPEMFYVDNFMMIIVGCYNVHLKNPFSVYGENFFILAQDVAIVLLIWKYNRGVKTITKIIVSISVSGLFLILYTDIIVSENMWTLMINIQFVLLTIARTPQIWHNFKNQSTGQLAIITYALNSLGGIARTLTLLKETTDFLNILVTLLSLLFNATLAFQIIYYWNSPSKAVNKIKDNTDEPVIVKKHNGSIPEKRAKAIID